MMINCAVLSNQNKHRLVDTCFEKESLEIYLQLKIKAPQPWYWGVEVKVDGFSGIDTYN